MRNQNFITPNPSAWFASAGSIPADELYGPPSNVLDSVYVGYPGAVQASATSGGYAAAGSGGHWYQDPAWHATILMLVGALGIHWYLKGE